MLGAMGVWLGRAWLLHLTCAGLFLALSVLVVARRPAATLNRTCGLLIFSFAFWSACLSVSHYPQVSKETAARFYTIGSFAWGSFASLAALFMAAFWRASVLRSKAFILGLCLPPIACVYAQATGHMAADYLARPWGYSYVWRDGPAAALFSLYYAVFLVGGLGVLLAGAYKDSSRVKRRQAWIIVLSAAPPLMLGSLTDVVLPRAGIYAWPNMAPDFTLIWVAGLVYAIVRYRMLELRPAVAADRVLDALSDAVFLIDNEGHIVWPNPAAVTLFRRSPDELRRMTTSDLLGSAPAGTTSVRHELTIHRQGAEDVEVAYATMPIRGDLDELIGWVGVATDVTARKRHETALRQARDALETRVAERTGELQAVNRRLLTEIAERKRSEEHYRLLIESMHEGVLVLDGDDKAVMVNSRLGQILGCVPTALLGKPLLTLVDGQSTAACTDALARAHAGTAAEGDWRFRREDGRVLSAIVQLSPLRGDGDQGRGCVLTVMDVTERETMQAQLVRAQRLASLGMLAAGVGHEINNPLTYVSLNLEQIGQLAAAGPPGDPQRDEVALLAREALEGTKRVQDIVKDLRRFSRGETRPLTAIDVHEALDDAIRLAHHEVRFRARLLRGYGAGVPRVLANAGSLSQVFLNLIVNAAHAIPEGHMANNEIRIRTWSGAQEVMIELADTGKGIPPEDMERLFDPFFSTKQANDGLGLGLAICHETIASLGGRIFVGSQVGQGSRFLIALKPAGDDALAREPDDDLAANGGVAPPSRPAPAAPTVPDTTVARDAGDAPARSRARILIVDDEDLVRRTIKRILERHFDVSDVASGEEARGLLAQDPGFDLVLCDLMMPGLSGMGLADWVAVNAPRMAPRMVFMTGGAFTREAEQFLKRIGNPTLEKPFDSGRVLEIARQTLERLGTTAA